MGQSEGNYTSCHFVFIFVLSSLIHIGLLSLLHHCFLFCAYCLKFTLSFRLFTDICFIYLFYFYFLSDSPLDLRYRMLLSLLVWTEFTVVFLGVPGCPYGCLCLYLFNFVFIVFLWYIVCFYHPHYHSHSLPFLCVSLVLSFTIFSSVLLYARLYVVCCSCCHLVSRFSWLCLTYIHFLCHFLCFTGYCACLQNNWTDCYSVRLTL